MTKKAPPKEDEAQSRRFIETAKAMQDAGELSPTDDGGALDRLMTKAAPVKRPAARLVTTPRPKLT